MLLDIENVGKQYRRDLWGLRHFTLSLGPGVFGLLGPNGAGKSTLMRVLATITLATEGQVAWNGKNIAQQPNELRRTLGYLPQDFGIYPNLNAVEFLEYLAVMKGLEGRAARRRVDELLQLVNLVDASKRPLGSYSGGMKQRVGVAQALLNDPQLLILDEPTVGLDPQERVRFRQLIADLSGDRLVILSTHIVSDVEAAATSMAIINKGQLITCGAPEQILKMVEGKVCRWTVPSQDLPAIRQKYLISGTIRHAVGFLVRVVSDGCPDAEAEPVAATVEDAYLYLVAHKTL